MSWVLVGVGASLTTVAAGWAAVCVEGSKPMKRTLFYLGAALLAVAACSGEAEPTTTTSAPTTTSSVVTTSTTIATTTTTTPPPPVIEIDHAGAKLRNLVRDLYALPDGGPEPAASNEILRAFATADGQAPLQGSAALAEWSDEVRLAVVTLDDDVTLAVADPDWRVIGGWWPSMGVDQHLGPLPKIVAVVGSDARPKENRETARADSIHFLGIDGDGHAAVVGVPRDSWVPLPGRGNSKINASLAYGGPDLMMETFASVTGLDFDGYVLTGFAGFGELIKVLGGLEIDVPHSFNDKAAKAYLDAGEQVLDAAQALAMSRTRKTLPGGDFSRQENGGLVLMAAQSMIRAGGVAGVPAMLAASQPHFSTDLDPVELLRLGAAVVRIDPDEVVNVVAPGGTGSAGGASVVFLRDSVTDLWEDLADGRLDQPE